jgi:hypothetical protein
VPAGLDCPYSQLGWTGLPVFSAGLDWTARILSWSALDCPYSLLGCTGLPGPGLDVGRQFWSHFAQLLLLLLCTVLFFLSLATSGVDALDCVASGTKFSFVFVLFCFFFFCFFFFAD